MTAKLADIARETRTSISTVSRVLAGGQAAQRISDSTCQRVLESATRLGYRPNLVARSLRTRKSNTVALLVSDIANPWFGAIGSLIEQSLHRHGYSLMLCNSNEDLQTELDYLRLLPQKGIDGLILVTLLQSREALDEHLPPGLPLVILDRVVPGVDCSVTTDQDQMAGLLCDTLERAGVKRVALVAGPEQVSTHRRRAEIVRRRFKIVAHHEGPAQKETGRQAFIKFLAVHPDAIVCTNNFLGQGVLDSIAQIDRPPIIACFDEIPMMHLLPVPIVCSIQDIAMLAEASVTQLLPQLQGQTTVLKPVLIEARAVTNPALQKRNFT